MKLTASLLLACGLLWGQNPSTAVFPGAVATDKTLFVATNAATTTLYSAISSVGATSISVISSALFIVPGIVRVDNESIAVCSKSTGTLVVCTVAADGYSGRGFSGTTAATHFSGHTVTATVDRTLHNQLAAEVKAIQTALGANLANVGTGVNMVSAAAVLASGALAVGDGARGLTASNLTGVLKVSSGVPSAVTGTASNCVLVDGTSGTCGTGGGGNTVITTGSGAPNAACLAPTTSNLALYWDSTAKDMYQCSNATGPVWQKILTDGAGSGKTGATQWGGLTSGGAGFTVNDIAGTSILYILPTANGSAGQVMYDTGAATCPTLETAPTSCHQLAWMTPASVASWTVAGTHIWTLMDAGRTLATDNAGYGTSSVNVLYCSAVPVGVGGTANSMDVWFKTGVSGTKGTAVGIYGSTGTLLKTTTLVDPTGQPQTYTISGGQALVAGSLYWFCWATEEATSELYSAFVKASEAAMLNAGTDKRVVTAANPATGTGAAFAMPAALGALTVNNSRDTTPFIQARP